MKTQKVFSAALAVIALTLLTACPGNPLKTAETFEQKADALYGQFVIAQRQVVVILENPAIPKEVKLTLADADAKVKPLADELLVLIIEYSAVKKAYDDAAGSGDPAALAGAEEKLRKYVERVTLDITKYFTDAAVTTTKLAVEAK